MDKKIPVFIFALVIGSSVANSQNSPTVADDEKKFSVDISADVVSRYIWRGLPLSLSSNVQPSITLSAGKFSFGAWGSYALSKPYSEADLFLTYDIGPFTVGLNDYYNEEELDLSFNDYYNYRNSDSPHSIEGSLIFNGTDNFPLSFTVGTFLYGADKDFDNNNYYSTYLEVAYTLSLKDTELNLFLGGTPSEGYYSDKAAIVNTGITATHELKISDSFSLPVYTSFIVNPDANDVFIVLGITF